MKTLVLSEGTEFVYGENARENSQLTRAAAQNHLWFHVAESPSAHGVLKSEKTSRSELLEAAAVIKQRSKLKDRRRVEVECIQVKHVKIINDQGTAELLKRSKKLYV